MLVDNLKTNYGFEDESVGLAYPASPWLMGHCPPKISESATWTQEE